MMSVGVWARAHRRLFAVGVVAVSVLWICSLLFVSSNAHRASAYGCETVKDNLQRGATDVSSGGQVSVLQRFLANYYVVSAEDLVTGFFGSRTKEYVQRFQSDFALPVLGIVGPRTRSVMQELCEQGAAQSAGVSQAVLGTTTVATTTKGTPVATTTPASTPSQAPAPSTTPAPAPAPAPTQAPASPATTAASAATVAAPTVTATTSVTNVSPTGNFTLTWSSTNATQCSITYGTSTLTTITVGLSGSKSFDPATKGTQYTVKCSNGALSASQTVTVTIVPRVVLSASASPTVVNAGEAITLTWNAANTNECRIFYGATGEQKDRVAPSGSRQYIPSVNGTSYRVLCRNALGIETETTVLVGIKPKISIAISPSAVYPNEQATFSWTSENARRCYVLVDGKQPTVDLALPSGTKQYTPSVDGKFYFVRCFGIGMASTTKVDATTTIVVKPAPLPSLTLTASKAAAGLFEPVTVSWSAKDAESCKLTYGPTLNITVDVEGAGSKTFNPYVDGPAYSVKCTGYDTARTVVSKSVTVQRTDPLCGVVPPGKKMPRGSEIRSCNGQYKFEYRTDGNLVVSSATTSATFWVSKTTDVAATHLYVVANRLILVDAANNEKWATDWFGGINGTHNGLLLKDTGTLGIYASDGKSLWFAGCGFLPNNTTLERGQSRYSCDKRYMLAFQGDGNLVLYDTSVTPRKAPWATGTNASGGVVAKMQGDGNLVVYDAANRAIWSSETSRKGAVGLYIQPTANLEILTADRTLLWQSGTTQIPTPTTPTSITVNQLDINNPMTWLMKTVCVNSANRVIAADPYYGCPVGSTIRKINAGEPLPYNNVDQGGGQQKDSFPVVNPKTWETVVVSSFDYAPFGKFNLYDASDGYDVYGVKDGWASAYNTQDGGGYSTAFYTDGCKVGSAWVLFPASGFLNAGSAYVPIMGVYWEQDGKSFAGDCPAGYSYDSRTDWWRQNYQFGGKGTNPVKTMDTIVSVHGYEDSESWRNEGHLEVFYFTREYGVTRWEAWAPVGQGKSQTSSCANLGTKSYMGRDFVVTDCRDWSNVKLTTSVGVPVVPIPNFNVVQGAHFDGASFESAWKRGGYSEAGVLTNMSRANATLSPRDTFKSPRGVSYLSMNCGAIAPSGCGPVGSQFVYQDIPINEFASGHTYGYGANLRVEPGQSSGRMRIVLQQLSADGRVLWSSYKDVTVSSNNGHSTKSEEVNSVYLTSAFIGDVQKIDFVPGVVTMRFALVPLTSHTFQVVNVWLSPWPTSGQTTAVLPTAFNNTTPSFSAQPSSSNTSQAASVIEALKAILERIRNR